MRCNLGMGKLSSRHGPGEIVVLAGLILLTSASIGCVAPAAIEQYPKRQIDRPYTLPKGIATWEPSWQFGNFKHQDSTTRDDSFGFLLWKGSLTDDITLVWAPIPVAIAYQIHRTDKMTLGASLGLTALSHSKEDNTTTGFSIGGYQKYLVTRWLGFVTTLSAADVRRNNRHGDSWGLTLTTGPEFQVTDTLALKAGIGYSVERNYPSIFHRPFVLERETYALIPLGAGASWMLDRGTELRAWYSTTSLGYPTGVREETLSIVIVNYW